MVIPDYIKDYNVTSESSTEELMTLARFHSEIGGYASSILESPYQQIGWMCRCKLNEIVDELRERNLIEEIKDLFVFSKKEMKRVLAILSSTTQLQTLRPYNFVIFQSMIWS